MIQKDLPMLLRLSRPEAERAFGKGGHRARWEWNHAAVV